VGLFASRRGFLDTLQIKGAGRKKMNMEKPLRSGLGRECKGAGGDIYILKFLIYNSHEYCKV
jgi:hypothetical protein